MWVPWPPSVNAMWRSVNGRVILSARGRQYRTDGLAALMTQCRNIRPMEGPLSVTLILYPPDRRRRDVDNYAKGILDLLTHAEVYGDDSQIDRLLIERGDVRPGGHVSVLVRKHVDIPLEGR